MSLQITKVFAVLVTLLALIGLTMNGHWLGLMNVDPLMDILRVGLGAVGIYIGFVSHSMKQAQAYLTVLGVSYIGLAVLGLISPTLFGLLPAGLTGFDIAFHLATGALATWAGVHHTAESRTFSHH